MRLQSIIVAAGSGTRLGGPKALLAWPILPQGWLVPLAIAHLEARAVEGPVTVVTRAPVAAALRRHAPLAFSASKRLVISTAPDALGPAGSIAAALSEIALDARDEAEDCLLITPVDVPPAAPPVVQSLLAALAAPGICAARPRHAGRGGHPVVVAASVLEPYRHPQPPPLREVLRRLGRGCSDVEVDDPTVAIDIDTPEDLARWSHDHGASAIDEPVFFALD